MGSPSNMERGTGPPCVLGMIEDEEKRDESPPLAPTEFMMKLLRSKPRSRGWEREPKKLYLTLNRAESTKAWGFSMIGGNDMLDQGAFWSGVVARRHEKGLWLQVSSIRGESSANTAGL